MRGSPQRGSTDYSIMRAGGEAIINDGNGHLLLLSVQANQAFSLFNNQDDIIAPIVIGISLSASLLSFVIFPSPLPLAPSLFNSFSFFSRQCDLLISPFFKSEHLQRSKITSENFR